MAKSKTATEVMENMEAAEAAAVKEEEGKNAGMPAEEMITISREELQALIQAEIRKTAEEGKAAAEGDAATASRAAEEKAQQKVKIMLPYDGRRYKDPVLVGVNGRFIRIQRGVEVEVPEYVAEVLRHSQEQDREFLRVSEENRSKNLSAEMSL